MNRNYELVVILDPELKGKEQEELLEKIKKQISALEGKVTKVEEWGKKELAYPLAKKGIGIFYVLEFSAPANFASSFREKLKLEEKVLRFLVLVKEEKKSPKKASKTKK
ncbi:MAG TPA: 30S ribosomal protein S6 [Clostridia bacterium]|nr:30S ribosomal protein S6 [Clostridia bacterium]